MQKILNLFLKAANKKLSGFKLKPLGDQPTTFKLRITKRIKDVDKDVKKLFGLEVQTDPVQAKPVLLRFNFVAASGGLLHSITIFSGRFNFHVLTKDRSLAEIIKDEKIFNQIIAYLNYGRKGQLAAKAAASEDNEVTVVSGKHTDVTPIINKQTLRWASALKGAIAVASNLKSSIKALRRSVQWIKRDIENHKNLLFVTGTAGVGKSYIINEELAMRGIYEQAGNIYVIRGFANTYNVIQEIESRPNDTFLFDDADGLLADFKFVNLLKNMTSTKLSERHNITYTHARKSIKISFRGMLIFISNDDPKGLAKISPHIRAILSRAEHVHFNVSPEAFLEYIKEILGSIAPYLDMQLKLDFFIEFENMTKWILGLAKQSNTNVMFSIRTFEQAINYLENSPDMDDKSQWPLFIWYAFQSTASDDFREKFDNFVDAILVHGPKSQ